MWHDRGPPESPRGRERLELSSEKAWDEAEGRYQSGGMNSSSKPDLDPELCRSKGAASGRTNRSSGINEI